MVQYHKKYKNFKPEVVKAVRKTIKQGLFKADFEKRYKLLNELLNSLNKIYNLEQKIKLSVKDYPTAMDGYYNPDKNLIVLNPKLSLITFLHEFKHGLQILNHCSNTEAIARGYSISLFYRATPKLCERAIKKGLIIHQREV